MIVDVDTATDVSMLADEAPAEDVWNVLVDETTTVETDWEEGETVVTEALALEESAEEVSEEEETPVLKDTLWRFAIARATSWPFAEAEEAVKRARRSVMASERMLMLASSARQVAEKWKCPFWGDEHSNCLQKSVRRSQTSELDK